MGKEILISEVYTKKLNLDCFNNLKSYNGEVTVSFVSSGDFSGYKIEDLKVIIANAVFDKLQNLSL